jgi:hypothetical protein
MPSPKSLSTALKVVAIVCSPIAALVIWLVGLNYIYPIVCSSSERILTPEAAVAFGREHLRKNKYFWRWLDVQDPLEMESILADCCGAARGDYYIKDPSRWRLYLSVRKLGEYDFQYELFFSECGKNVRAEKLAVPFPSVHQH